MSQLKKQRSEEKRSVLVCVSASPSNQKVIRSAGRFAQGGHHSFVALYIDDGRTPAGNAVLQRNLALAKSVGASVETVPGRDVIAIIAQYAAGHGITDLFIGYSGPTSGIVLQHHPAYRLVRALPQADVHIIPDASVQLQPSQLESRHKPRFTGRDLLRMTAIMSAATALSVLVDRSRFSNSNIVTIYILAVLITAAVTAERMYGIIAAILYILLFNYLFINPRFSLLVYDPDYMVTYLVSVIAAVITGNISSRMKEITVRSRMYAYQTQILLNASEALQRAQGSEEIIRITVSRLEELLEREIWYCDAGEFREAPEAAVIRLENGQTGTETVREQIEAMEWTLAHNQRAGWGTRHFSGLSRQFLSVRTGNEIYGILSVASGQSPLNQFEENILLALITECALSLENEKNRKEREEAQIIAENERFRSKLLRSVSHDLRTPLTSISGNADNLMAHEDQFTEGEKQQIYSDIYEDAIWLIELVENLLAITKLEDQVAIHLSGEIVADVLETAVENARRHARGHRILLETDAECLVARMDVPLILQVLDNLIGNAVKHTPTGTTVTIRDWQQDDLVMVSVSDDGPGIPQEEKPHVFDLFYTGSNRGSDSGRSLGLGLNLCRSILERHGQTITVQDGNPCGTVFLFSLQLWKEEDYETISDPDRGR